MTFEEFFKKKKIDLAQLQSSEPALFAEFKSHYEQMGEKSFDHTKKYWFNPLRRRFVPPVEIKTEKVIIENQIAEQTITESLMEASAPSVGFKPRFKAAVPPQPTEDTPTEQPAKTEDTPAPATGFKPRFKAAMVTKPVEEAPAEQLKADEVKSGETEAPKPATGFKPRFKASMVTKPVDDTPVEEPKPVEATPEETEAPKPSVGFKPRFKASMINNPAEEKPIEETKAEEPITEEKPAEEALKSVGFKPRFNAAKMKPKEPGE